MSAWLYYSVAILILLCNVASWLANLVSLPGNWVVVGIMAVAAWLMPEEDGRGITWFTVGVLVGLAILGEIIEFVASAAGAAQQGASRRGVVLSLLGTLVGSVIGVFVGVPIPLVGSAIAAIAGGALGAFVGAYLGEQWKGSDQLKSFAISQGALTGRLLGTLGKLVIGAIMVVVATFDSFF